MEEEGILVIKIPVKNLKLKEQKNFKLKIFIEYTLQDSLSGLLFQSYYNSVTKTSQEYCYTEEKVTYFIDDNLKSLVFTC